MEDSHYGKHFGNIKKLIMLRSIGVVTLIKLHDKKVYDGWASKEVKSLSSFCKLATLATI